MQRIHNDNRTWTHPEAKRWLTEFMIDLKKMVLIETDYQPFTIERLNEWTEKHNADIASCVDYESSMVKHISDELIPEHLDALACFNGLVIDLKLLAKGIVVREITSERIEEADKCYMQICQCRKRRLIYY